MYFQLKRLVYDLQTEIFGQNLAFKEGEFDNFQAQKSRFLDFFKNFLKWFWKCYGIVFRLKMPALE